MKIRITGKGLPKAQYQNSQMDDFINPFDVSGRVDKNQFSVDNPNMCGPGYKYVSGLGCIEDDSYDTKPMYDIKELSKSEPRADYAKYDMAKAKYEAGPITNNQYNKKNKFLAGALGANAVLDTAIGITGMASNFYKNYLQGDRQMMNKLQHRAALPDLQTVMPMGLGMWTTNQNRQSPRNQYTPNIGQSTNVFYPGMQYGQDGIEAGGPPRVQKAFLPDPNYIFPISTPGLNFSTGFSAQPSATGTIPSGVIPAQPSTTTATDASSATTVTIPAETSVETPTESSSKYFFPLKNYKVTSGFGSRKAPKKGASTNHNGVDLGVPENTPVYAPFDGVVEKLYTNDKGGKQMIIRHSDGSKSGYAHLNEFIFAVGDKVKKGDKVALSGNTGNSTGPHLHMTWRNPEGVLIDPMSVLKPRKTSGSPKPDITGGLTEQVSLSHNNPMNIHYGKFAEKYNATPGVVDGDGRVAIFPSFEVGLQANKDLLFGSAYNNLTIREARNKWVTGDKNKNTRSTNFIVKEMGTNKKLNELTIQEREKLFKQFVKWEGKQAYKKIKDMKLFEGGGEFNIDNTSNTNTMRIRIISGPVNKMKYGGQLGYGFDLGQRNTYSAMNQDSFEESSQRLKPIDREDANIEAEKDETAYGDFDGDGMNEHMVIGGERHSNGGTPLNVPKGTFIFSDTAKMKIKDKSILNYFGVGPKKGGYTPAQIAKRFDINKYKAMLESPLYNQMEKNTARLMIDEYEKKLGYLSLVQESKKGFPQGIPKVAESVTGQFGGETSFGTKSPEMEVESAKMGGTMLPKAYAGMDYGYGVSPYEQIIINRAATPSILAKASALPYGMSGVLGATPLSGNVAWGEGVTVPDVPNITTTQGYTPYGITPAGKLGVWNALANIASLKKYDINYQRLKAVTPDVVMQEPLGRAQQRQQAYARAADTIATMMPGQSAIPNLTMMAGQTGEGVSADMNQIAMANIMAKAQNDQMKANILNNEIQYNTGITNEERKDKLALARDFESNARQGRNAITAVSQLAIDEASNIFNMNVVEGLYHYIDPRTKTIKFRSEDAKAAFEAAMRKASSAKDPNEMTAQLAAMLTAIKKGTGASDQDAIQLLKLFMGDKNAVVSPKQPATTQAKATGGSVSNIGYNYYNPFLP